MLYDLRNLDNHTRQLITMDEVDKLLEGRFCSICNGAFIGRKEKDEAVVSGKNPFTVAHSYCWNKRVSK